MKDSELLKRWMDANEIGVPELVEKTNYSRAHIYKQLAAPKFSKDFKETLKDNGIDIYENVLKTIPVDDTEYNHWMQETIKSKDALISAKDMVIDQMGLRIKNLEDMIQIFRDGNTNHQKLETKFDEGIQMLLNEFRAPKLIRTSK